MYYNPKPKIETMTVSTSVAPDQPEIMDFKKRVKEALKKGYKPDGQMQVKADGSLVQQFSRASK